MLVGIDFSINSPSICIYKNNEYKFIILQRNRKLTKLDNELKDLIDIIWIDSIKDSNNYQEEQWTRFLDSYKMCDIICRQILKYGIPEYIAIEGFSFGSTSIRFAELVGYQYQLRNKLYNKFFTNRSDIPIKIYAPQTIKKTAGSGKFDKIKMFESFLNLNLNFSLYNYININKDNLKMKNSIRKPIDDIIDSYYIIETLKNDINK